MGWLSGLILVVVSTAFLAFQYPAMLRAYLPTWLAPAEHSNTADRHAAASHDKDESGDQGSDGDLTPKVEANNLGNGVPTFTLNGDDENNDTREDEAPVFPALNSAQRAPVMPPPPKSPSGPSLMPPPARHNILAPRQSATVSLRVPTTGPLPNRGPPVSSQQRVSASLSPNGTIPTPNPRGKVLLKPGHSPMDWAALTRTGNLSGVGGFQRVTPSQLKAMTGRKGKPAWSTWQGKVYNITPYLPFHPGGEAELMKAAGRDGMKLFMDVHPWVNWENMLGTCLVGVLVPEDYGQSSLEEMD